MISSLILGLIYLALGGALLTQLGRISIDYWRAPKDRTNQFKGFSLPSEYFEKFQEAREVSSFLADLMKKPWEDRLIQKGFHGAREVFDPLLQKCIPVFRELKALQKEFQKDSQTPFWRENDWLSLDHIPLEQIQKYLALRNELDRYARVLFERLREPWEQGEIYGYSYKSSSERKRKPKTKQTSSEQPTEQTQTHTHTHSAQEPRRECNVIRPDFQSQKPHEVLGVEEEASTREIVLAYRDLMKRHHPDRVPVSQHTSNVESLRAHQIAARLNASKKQMIERRRRQKMAA